MEPDRSHLLFLPFLFSDKRKEKRKQKMLDRWLHFLVNPMSSSCPTVSNLMLWGMRIGQRINKGTLARYKI